MENKLLQTLVPVVQGNCDISDSRHAGKYSMCTFLLKMREYYRWQQGIPLSDAIPRDAVGDWLVSHEQYWEDLYASAYASLSLAGSEIAPFEAREANQHLLSEGLVYSAGRGIFSKPHFFLGELVRHEQQDGIDIFISGHEYARDLVAPPAMLCDDQVFIRQQSVRRFIWEKIEENRWRRLEASPVIESAREHGLDITEQDITAQRFEALLDSMTELETLAMLQHELGEVAAGRHLPTQWDDMLMSIAGAQAEFIARAVRDHLADAMSTLPWLLDESNTAALHFYFGNYTGLRKVLFPEALSAYEEFVSSNSRSALEDLCGEAELRWKRESETVLELFTSSEAADVAAMIEQHFHDRIHAA